MNGSSRTVGDTKVAEGAATNAVAVADVLAIGGLCLWVRWDLLVTCRIRNAPVGNTRGHKTADSSKQCSLGRILGPPQGVGHYETVDGGDADPAIKDAGTPDGQGACSGIIDQPHDGYGLIDVTLHTEANRSAAVE
jgi:hypothetical protein